MPEIRGLYGLAPGVDFPEELVRGLENRLEQGDPAAWGRVTLIVNTRRMARRIRAIFDKGPARLLPRMLLLNEVDQLLVDDIPQPATPTLRRHLELAQMVEALATSGSTLGEGSSVFDLAESLAALMDEMQGEGVTPETIAALDVSDHSEHFRQTQAFLGIVRAYLNQTRDGPDPEERQRLVAEALIAQWSQSPPQHPVILAGSTASRGTTRLLAEAVAGLPQGAVVFPGFDFAMPAEVWDALARADEANLPTEDHAQFRFCEMLNALGLEAADVDRWTDAPAPNVARNQLVSLAMRPAPVTDAWLSEGPDLGDLNAATRELTLVEAETPRAEASVIAMRFRAAVEEGKTVALITPDRMLTRQVAAALDRWDILPDDSAGLPLQLSPPGRFLRHCADMMVRRLDVETLLTVLKHPLCHSGTERNTHVLNLQRLEMRLRDDVVPYPDSGLLRHVSLRIIKAHGEAFEAWLDWVSVTACGQVQPNERSLADWVSQHRALAEALAAGLDGTPEELWARKSGEKCLAALERLAENGEAAGMLSAGDYADLFGRLLAADEVRDRDAPHPGVMIWGTLEARVQGADLVILGGLNENTWPEAPAPDPWLNRSLRHKAGLLLPDRRIGLAAHDFQQAIAAKEVWLTRAVRSADAETVASRWLNRLTNLLEGLPGNGGPEALARMRRDGQDWLARARVLETPIESPKAKRPHPCPPVAARPRKISVSDVRRLIRDPYAVYARKCLGLSPLGPLRPEPDALLRGTALHGVFEQFLKAQTDLTAEALLDTALRELSDSVPWNMARTLWLARLERIADWFIETESARQDGARPGAFEVDGRLELTELGVTVTAKADRIDFREDGTAIVYDYKTGTPPGDNQQIQFDRQLLIEALMIEEGAFRDIVPMPIGGATYIGIGGKGELRDAPLANKPTNEIRSDLLSLLESYLDADQGYTSRRAQFKERDEGDYDQLARFGEWEASDVPNPERVG